MAQMFESLPLTQEPWMELQAPGFLLAQLWIFQAFGVSQQMEDLVSPE